MAGSSYNQTYSFWDLFRGRGGRRSADDNQGFIFVEQSGQTKSGEKVNVDNLLDEATTMTCINAIVQGITQIPLYVRKEMPDGSYESLKKHPITKLMKRPNDYQTPTEFKSSIVTSMLTHGNAFIRIVRASNGRVVQLYPLDPSDITIGSNAMGRPTYAHEDDGGPIESKDIIHIRDLNTYTPQGLSRALLMAEIIGAKKAADALMAYAFKNGMSLQYAVTSNSPTDANRLKTLQDGFKEAFGKFGARQGGVAFIDNGNIQKLDGLKPADVDLRELREMLITEIAAGFRVPRFMAGAGGNDTYNNVRQYWTAFHRDTLQPLVTNIEEAITLKLLSGDEYLYFDIQEILKGDVEITSRVAHGNVSNGIWTPNEARASMGTPPSDDPNADLLVPPNSTINTNITPEETPENATGGGDGPQGQENVEDGQ